MKNNNKKNTGNAGGFQMALKTGCNKKKRAVRFFLFFLIIILLPINKRLAILSGGKTAYISPPVRRFSISYTHSVNKSAVEDFFRISGGKLILEKTVFFSFGAGMPAADRPDASFELSGGNITLAHSDKCFESLTYNVAREAGFLFTSGADSFYLEDIAPVFSAVTFKVKYVSLFSLMSARLKYLTKKTSKQTYKMSILMFLHAVSKNSIPA